ncbi:molecular chaperone HscC [Cellvibrio polysaccharolyticus]|uniref:Molecular chaperone HscC n=1 Tax=Cellvibrio polysaccharolyticus TaxID=2082724 RepID=A0A928V4F0_9GAMM|nr:molecular chaperone HscC [Cellvibrio polysaccharolyticus]MBE8718591.1 molecular chaperone HscC [Cellvibrio polysaccharolyticus]
MTVIGIDLGTTNSACGYWGEAGATLVPNRLGELLTPSVVGLDESGKVVVGKTAKERLIDHSDKTVGAFKRLMGSNHKVQLADQVFSAPELSSLILRSLKEDAESHLGVEVTEAVISVPAYFNESQRQATRMAGELAGLKVQRLINEPTAAAIAYGLNDKQEGTFLILDFGGGTFDVTILEFFDGIMEVHASAGDNFLGGEDFVDAMVDALLGELAIARSTLSKKTLQMLYMQMETAKRRISQIDKYDITLNIDNVPSTWSMTPDWFARVVTPLILRCKQPVEQALRDAKLSLGAISDIILVGGSTKLGLFRNTMARMLGRFPSCNLDPDLVVAMGAAVQAGLVARNEALEDIVLTDICPYSLGTSVVNNDSPKYGHYFFPIIERNSVVPASVVRRVFTASDMQTQVKIDVYQGESRYVKKNVFLGDLNMSVPAAPKGQEAIDIRYSYDVNGLLEVDATVISTQITRSITLERNAGQMSESQKQASHRKLAELKFHPRDGEENRALLARGERLYETSLGDLRGQIAALLASFERVLEEQNPNAIMKARKSLRETFDKLDREEWL